MTDKLSKDDVHYENKASMPAARCGLCAHFLKPDACEIVAGQVNRAGWCDHFEKRKAARLYEKK